MLCFPNSRSQGNLAYCLFINYRKRSNKRPVSNKRHLSNKRPPPPPYAVKLVLNAPCLINAPLENCPQILGNGEIERDQSIY